MSSSQNATKKLKIEESQIMKSRQRAETFGKAQILDPKADLDDKIIKPPAMALGLELEGNKVGLPG